MRARARFRKRQWNARRRLRDVCRREQRVEMSRFGKLSPAFFPEKKFELHLF